MRYIILGILFLLTAIGSATALSVQPVTLPKVNSTVPYKPGVLEVQQAGLYSQASTDSTKILQGN